MSKLVWKQEKAMQKPLASRELLASFGCAYAGVVWGLFWLPLRGLSGLGISPSWASTLFFLVPAILCLPLALWRAGPLMRMGWQAHITCAVAIFSMVLYAEAVLRTEVIRAILLFYLTPLWSTLLGRLLLGETITTARWLSMALAFGGLLVMFGDGGRIGLPHNVGDWMGLGAGMIWAYAAVRLRRSHDKDPIDMSLGFTLWGVPAALLFVASPTIWAEMPDMAQISPALPWLIPFAAFIMLPGYFTGMYGARHLSPGLVGLLFMTEIVVGTFTAAIWAGEPMGMREWAGVTLIMGAGLLESLWSLKKSRAALP
jgi:drug/metabolite transporter (DMT)-like permease